MGFGDDFCRTENPVVDDGSLSAEGFLAGPRPDQAEREQDGGSALTSTAERSRAVATIQSGAVPEYEMR